MSHLETTLDGCLRRLPGPMEERIRGSKQRAKRQTGPHGRPQTVHLLQDSQGTTHSEVWEQEEKQLASGGNGCVVVLQSKVLPQARRGCPPQHRAVKIIPVVHKRWKYYLRELDALIRFSEHNVRSDSRKSHSAKSLMQSIM